MYVRKKERKKMNKMDIFYQPFSQLSERLAEFWEYFCNRRVKLFMCKCFAVLCCRYRGVTPTPYVQDAILNLPNTYTGSTTVLPNTLVVMHQDGFHTPYHFVWYQSGAWTVIISHTIIIRIISYTLVKTGNERLKQVIIQRKVC